MKRIWHWIIHRFGYQPCTLIAVLHDENCNKRGIEYGCCNWHAVVRCVECGEEIKL